jgi:hypothetical protein
MVSFFTESPGRMGIRLGEQRIATYVWEDPAIPRPYFCNVFAPDGTRITRTHPPDPVADKDNMDHAEFHPGIWLAFGDLGGADFWRLKARVRHVEFSTKPTPTREGGAFSVVNVYETLEEPPREIAQETCIYSIQPDGNGYCLSAESIFKATQNGVAFGDQEEMGFGIRLGTPVTVKHGSGTMRNSAGGVNEAGTWGKQAEWCAASGVVEGHRAGAMLAQVHGPVQPSWFHSRDYGLMVANAFGKKSMTAPDDDSVAPEAMQLEKGEELKLGFALYIFSMADEGEPDYSAIRERLRL